jgi:hypothetical protein
MHIPPYWARALTRITLPLIIAACGHGGIQPAPPTPMPSLAGAGPEAEEGVPRLRAATAAFRDLNNAVAAGYAREVSHCVDHPPLGAMGFHHGNQAYVDKRLEIEHPEILTYEREPNGHYSLTGAEYVIPYELWPADSTPPTLFGQPLKRAPNLHVWYLHVWAWKENPSGLFADWNPAVKCPAG